jgi:hypothetical protein
METWRNAIERQVQFLIKFERQHNVLLFLPNERESEAFKNQVHLIEDWLLKNPKIEIGSYEFHNFLQSDEFKKFQNHYYEIPFKTRANAISFPYSKDYVILLGDYLSLSILLWNLRTRTRY